MTPSRVALLARMSPEKKDAGESAISARSAVTVSPPPRMLPIDGYVAEVQAKRHEHIRGGGGDVKWSTRNAPQHQPYAEIGGDHQRGDAEQ